MDDQAPVVSSTSQRPATRQHEGRGAWVLTGYCISGLALFAILAYFISEFLSH
jgi:hypothetical protein